MTVSVTAFTELHEFFYQIIETEGGLGNHRTDNWCKYG